RQLGGDGVQDALAVDRRNDQPQLEDLDAVRPRPGRLLGGGELVGAEDGVGGGLVGGGLVGGDPVVARPVGARGLVGWLARCVPRGRRGLVGGGAGRRGRGARRGARRGGRGRGRCGGRPGSRRGGGRGGLRQRGPLRRRHHAGDRERHVARDEVAAGQLEL